jgi:iron(III) transport system substrate-binding protein
VFIENTVAVFVKTYAQRAEGEKSMVATRRTFAAVLIGYMAVAFSWCASGDAQILDEVYQKALTEGGTLNFYGTLAPNQASKILPVFEKRFPGIKVNQIDLTSDALATRAITEARAGKTIADVFQASLEIAIRIHDQRLLLEKLPPEAEAYPSNLKGSYWLAGEFDFIIAGWNTNLVKKQEEPKQFEDFAEPHWKGRLIAEARDAELLIGLTNHKYKSEERAVALLKRIAANGVEFHKGHSQLAELLTAGQAAACLTCYSHHFPVRINKGAPLGYLLSEGIGAVTATAVFKNAPHPNTAWLFYRWVSSEEGQRVFSAAGRTPAHPKVEPVEKTRPEKIYPITDSDYKQYSKYEKIWKEIFKLG